MPQNHTIFAVGMIFLDTRRIVSKGASHDYVGITIINRPFGNGVYQLSMGMTGGWLTIVLPTLAASSYLKKCQTPMMCLGFCRESSSLDDEIIPNI